MQSQRTSVPIRTALGGATAWWFAMLMIVAILVATLMPVGPKNELIRPFPAYLHIDKVGHFLGFAVLAGALRCTARVSPAAIVALALLLGASTEALQFIADGRMAKLTDVLIDAAGGALGVGAAAGLLRLRAAKTL